MLIRFRLDKTAKAGVWVSRRFCNIACTWCHHDYFEHDGFAAIGNADFCCAVQRVIEVSQATEAHVRLAGDGEPTLVGEPELSDLIVRLKLIRQVTKIKITTNGILLGGMVNTLRNVGVDTVTVSVNSLNHKKYEEYTGYDYLDRVISSLSKAHLAGLKLKVNTIFWRKNADELPLFDSLSSEYGGMPIKYFDLLIGSEQDRELYLPLSYLERQLVEAGATYHEEMWPYPKRVYLTPSGAVFEVKIAGTNNNCPNLHCAARKYCLEGCRHSVRIGLDGKLRPCGVRSDNTVNLLDPNTSNEHIWQALHSGGKVGYEALWFSTG